MDSETKDKINRLRDTAMGSAALLQALADSMDTDDDIREALRLIATSLKHTAWEVDEQ